MIKKEREMIIAEVIMLHSVWLFHACVHCQMVECGPAYVSQTVREQRSLWCWQRRPRPLNPHYPPLIIVFFPVFIGYSNGCCCM